MAFKAGTTAAFYLGNAAASLVNVAPYVDNISYPQSVNMLDVSTMGTNSKAFIPGLADGDTITISGPYDVAIVSQLGSLKAVHAAGSAASGFVYGPGGSVATQARVAGSVWLAGFTPAAQVGGRVEWSATLQVTGSVLNSTF